MNYLVLIVACCLLMGCAHAPNSYDHVFQGANPDYRLYETTPEILYEEPYLQLMSLLGVLDNLESGYLEGGEEELARRIENKREFVSSAVEWLKLDLREQRELMGEHGRIFRYEWQDEGRYENGLIILGEDGKELQRWMLDSGPLL